MSFISTFQFILCYYTGGQTTR